MNYPKISIIILNWNGWKDTIECLESLYKITYPNYDVIVVDNGSTNDSIEKIKGYCSGKIRVGSKFFGYSNGNKPIKIIEYGREEADYAGKEKEITDLPSNRKLILIKNERNYGFAKGNNIGMKYALKALNPDYVLLLNNDTVVDREFLGKLVEVAENDERIGVIGPRIYYYDVPKKIWFSGGLIKWVSTRITYHLHTDICDHKTVSDYVTGCAILIRKEAIKNVGYFDEKYFLYFEDTDYCIRAKRAGFKITVVQTSAVYHKISSSSGKPPESGYYFHRNRFLLIKKYCPYRYLPAALFSIFLRFLTIAGLLLVNNERENLFAVIKAYRTIIKDLI